MRESQAFCFKLHVYQQKLERRQTNGKGWGELWRKYENPNYSNKAELGSGQQPKERNGGAKKS